MKLFENGNYTHVQLYYDKTFLLLNNVRNFPISYHEYAILSRQTMNINVLVSMLPLVSDISGYSNLFIIIGLIISSVTISRHYLHLSPSCLFSPFSTCAVVVSEKVSIKDLYDSLTNTCTNIMQPALQIRLSNTLCCPKTITAYGLFCSGFDEIYTNEFSAG